MGFLLSLILGFIPMFLFAGFVYWLDHYEKEPRQLLGGAFVWGAVIAAGAAFLINTFIGAGIFVFTGSEAIAEWTTGSIVAPVVEEILKGTAVLLVFLFFKREFDSILDGIVYAAITALGFAATENTYYIYTFGYLENGFAGLWNLAFIRIILVGWQHPFYTAFFGIGLALARMNRSTSLKILYPLAGLAVSMLLHGFHNTIPGLIPGLAGIAIGAFFDWSGWLVLFAFILYMISRERQLLRTELAAELNAGILTETQYRTASSTWAQLSASISALGTPKFHHTRHFYQLCAELAHKKHQFNHLGDEKGNQEIITYLRTRLQELASQMA